MQVSIKSSQATGILYFLLTCYPGGYSHLLQCQQALVGQGKVIMCCLVSLSVLFVLLWGKGNTWEEVSSYIPPHTACGK